MSPAGRTPSGADAESNLGKCGSNRVRTLEESRG